MDEEEEVGVRTTARAEEGKSGRVILNTRELTEQIHQPTLSLSVSFPFNPPICLLFLFSFSPSSVCCRTSYSPNQLKILLPPIFLLFLTFSPHFPKKFDLNEQMKRGGERWHQGSPGRAGSALCGSVFVYSGLPHVKLSDSLFAIISFCRQKYWALGSSGCFQSFPV